MHDRKDTQTRFWIRKQDSLGNPMDQRLIDAAKRVYERARLVMMRYLFDDTEFEDIFEAAVDSVSRAMGNNPSIQFLDKYLLSSVAREAIRRSRRSQRITYVDTADLERIAGATSFNPEQRLDDAKRIERLRVCMDGHVLKMYDLRVLGYSWGEIATLMGYADRHSAEVQFRKGIDKALHRFRAHHGSPEKPHGPESKSSES